MSQNVHDSLSEDRILVNVGGSATNNLNHILSHSDENTEDMAMLTHSSYTQKLNDAVASTKDNFTVFSINAKFNYPSPLLLDLCNKGTGFSAICL